MPSSRQEGIVRKVKGRGIRVEVVLQLGTAYIGGGRGSRRAGNIGFESRNLIINSSCDEGRGPETMGAGDSHGSARMQQAW